MAVASLRPCRPNPFNPRTTISWDLGRSGQTRLQVVDLRGRLVATLVDDVLPAGAHDVVWAGKNDQGVEMPSGVYLSRLETAGQVVHGRMMLVR